MPEELQLRIYCDVPGLPTLIYLPGTHGDWTLIGNFRRALHGRVRFVEFTYPRTLTWSAEDYAAEVETVLQEHGITSGWLLAESFSSVIAWPMAARRYIQVHGLVLAGGFVQHPVLWGVRLAERIIGQISCTLLKQLLGTYAKMSRFRFRHDRETMADIQEFLARRTELDRLACKHRLHLITGSDPCSIARSTQVPVFAITGMFDPLVPWTLVRRWLRRHCPALREFVVVRSADHNVLSTAPEISADQVVRWIKQS